ncbi:MAG TPA: hypothetical protein VGC83_09315 [Solirubrobacteraceae bacterium]|jgi:hypothetical protein
METRLLIAGEQVAGEGRGLDGSKHVHIETKIAAKSWWYPYGTTA